MVHAFDFKYFFSCLYLSKIILGNQQPKEFVTDGYLSISFNTTQTLHSLFLHLYGTNITLMTK